MSLSLIPGLALITDANGNFVASTCGQVPATTNAAGASTSSYAGILSAGLNSSGVVTPLSVDSSGANVTRAMQYLTASVAPSAAFATGTAAGKSMLSFFNASSSNYFRVLSITAQCPPQFSTTGGGLSSTVTTYTPIMMALSFMTSAHSGGTLLNPVCHDSRDASSLDTNFTVRQGATISNESTSPVYVWDAAYNARADVAERIDLGAKVLTLGPQQGLNVRLLSTPSSSVNFYMVSSFSQTTM